MIRAALAAAAITTGFAGCATSPPLLAGLDRATPLEIELERTPFFAQDDYQCGPAALATLLVASGVAVTPEELAPQVYVPGRKGSLQAELIAATRRRGRLPYVLATTADELIAELVDGRPVLVLQNLGAERLPRWHYAVLIGYDAVDNVAILRSGRKQRVEMQWQRFAKTWHRGGRWAMTTLTPGDIPAHADAVRYVEAIAGLEAAGQRAAATAAYESAIVRWPSEPRTWLGLGNVALAGGVVDAAADAYLRAILLAPADPAARNNLAELLAVAGCVDEARAQVARASALAAGTALETAVAGTRAKIDAVPATDSSCALAGRSWPE